MKIFQNRAIALLLAVVVVLLTLGVSAYRFADDARAVEKAFFTAKSGKAPVYYVDQIISAAASLADVGEKYPALSEQAEAMRAARKALVKAENVRDISDIYDACQEVSQAAGSFAAQAEQVTMSEYDTGLAEDAASDISGAIRKLSECGYNETAREFIENRYNSFPASLYARLLGVREPELFAAS